MPLRRPQKVLVAAVQTDAIYWWGAQVVAGSQSPAPVLANRLSRVQRVGQVDRAGQTYPGEGHSGFGPAPPVVTGAGIAFRGPKVIRTRSRLLTEPRRLAHSTLRPPRVVGQILAPPILRALAWPKVPAGYRPERRPIFVIRGPVVVDRPLAPPIEGYLTPPRSRPSFLAGFKLGEPQVIIPAFTFVAAPVAVHLARSSRGAPKSRLFPPAVVTAASTQTFTGPRVTLARSSRGAPKSHLYPPVVVGPILARPLAVRLAASSRGKPRSFLRPMGSPAVVYAPVTVHLVRIRPARTIARLRPPTVIDLTPQTYYLAVALAYSRRGTPRSFLRPPTDTVGPEDQGRVAVHLAYSRRGAPRSRLSAPTVVAPVLARPTATKLAASLRGRPRSRLAPPTVVGPVLAPPILVRLARIRPPRVASELRPPTAVFSSTPADAVATIKLVQNRPAAVHSHLYPPTVVSAATPYFRREPTALVRIRPVRTIADLRPPVVIDLSPQAYYLAVTLAPSFRGRPRSILRAPAVVAAAPPVEALVHVHLARNKVPPVHPRLGPPTVVAPVLARALLVKLAYSLRGRPRSILRPPAVVGPVLAPPIDEEIVVRLALSTRPKTRSILFPPAVVAPVLARPILVKLARIVPPPVHSILREPTVIDLRPQTYYLATTLAYSLRGRPKSILFGPSKFAPTPKAETTLAVTLAYSVRGRPRSILGEPTVVTAATPYLRPVDVTLAYSRRGRPRSVLGEPVVVAQVVSPPVRVKLAPSRYPRPMSILRDPVVVGPVLARPTKITLAPQRRGVPKSRLRVVIYAARVFAPVRVVLAPSTRIARLPHSELRPPTVVSTFTARPLLVHLAPSSRGRPRSILRGPRVLKVAYPGLAVHLAYSKRGRPRSFLRPPAVIILQRFIARPIDVTLVRIRPPRVHAFLPSGVVLHICYGVATGTVRPSAENDVSTTPGASAAGSVTPGAAAAGSVDTTTTIHGSSRPSAENDISDEQREGC